jgi:outer membrane protein TolC
MKRHGKFAAAALLCCAWLVRWRAADAQPAAPGPEAPAPGTPGVEAPALSDPMLAPPPAAAQELRSWDEVIAMLRRSPSYLTSVAEIERAAAQRRIALAAVLPTLTGSAGYAHNFNSVTVPMAAGPISVPPPTVWSASATASWNIINPRAIYGLGTADLATSVANLSLADRRRVLASSVVSALLATLAAAHTAELDRTGLRSALERLALTQTRLRFSRGTELDVDRARQDVAVARAQLISGDESLRQSREALGQALGSATPIAAAAELDLEGFERAVASTCRLADSVERRADVAAAAERVAIAGRQIKDAELLLSPSLAIGSTAGYASAVTLGPTTTWSVGATLTVPFYDGGARYGAIREARAAAEQARDALASVRIEAMIEVARASRAIAVDTAARTVAREQRDLAARIDARTREGYAKGVGTSLDLVISAQALRQAEINLVLLDFELAQAQAGAVLANAECIY